MAKLCSTCINSIPQNVDLKNKSEKLIGRQYEQESLSITNPICQAIKKLQAKIRELEIQRSEETTKLQLNSCVHFIDDNNNNQFNATHDSPITPMCNRGATFIPENCQQPRLGSNNDPIDPTEISCKLEKDLASDALKMAEKRCTLLENQLSAMKRLFLRKLSQNSEQIDKDPCKETKPGRKKVVKETLNESKVTTDVENVYSFNFDVETVDDFSSESEFELFNVPLTCFDTKESHKGDNRERMNRSYKGRGGKNLSNVDHQSIYTPRLKNRSHMIGSGRVEHPFILGGSSSTSYNANAKIQRARTNVAATDGCKPPRATNITNTKQLAESCVQNLRSIYSELCTEYEVLLNKKVKILDLVTPVKGKDHLHQQQRLDHITKALSLKRQQIHKMKTLINNFNDTFKSDYANIRWDI